MEERKYYAAIDLGTTNSVLAYGNMIRNKMKPVILDIDRKNETGGVSRNTLLPSTVFYYKNSGGAIVADVGDYAKSRYGTQKGYVCKSVKSMMGVTDHVPLVEEIPDKTPADVSAQILSFMVNSARKRLFQQDLQDVVITVPASFDSDQCQATIDAAKKAGINVENIHDILLYEPKAVIYDFMRMQEEGEIPEGLLSLETNKNVLVFDLGGGTLDVTLHRVGYTEQGSIGIKDLAISRYTLLGGDNFDELLALDMLQRFEEMYNIKVNIRRKEEVMCKLRKLAEQLKTNLSMEYENAQMAGKELPENYLFEVMDINLYDAYAFECTYTKGEIENIFRPLMGYQYKLKDAGKVQAMDEREVGNIVYPILDVLEKAGKNLQIDAVLLNGGMTKFYLIRQRLKDLFGFEPLETSDPDLSVAKGAVYYHYCLHKYNVRKIDYFSKDEIDGRSPVKCAFPTGTILNDSINLGLRGEYVSLLIPAGTELPYRSEEIRNRFKFDRETDKIGIELFLGRGLTKNFPNRRIATRVVKFEKTYPAGTPLSFRIYIDSLRIMTMEAWITDKLYTRTIMEMDVASLKIASKASKDIRAVGKMKLNAKSELHQLKVLTEKKGSRTKKDVRNRIDKSVAAIKHASNAQDFYPPIIDMAKNCNKMDMLLGCLYEISLTLGEEWNNEQRNQILKIAKSHFFKHTFTIRQRAYTLKRAVKIIVAYDPDALDFFADYLHRVPEEDLSIRQEICSQLLFRGDNKKEVLELIRKTLKVEEITEHIRNMIEEGDEGDV